MPTGSNSTRPTLSVRTQGATTRSSGPGATATNPQLLSRSQEQMAVTHTHWRCQGRVLKLRRNAHPYRSSIVYVCIYIIPEYRMALDENH